MRSQRSGGAKGGPTREDPKFLEVPARAGQWPYLGPYLGSAIWVGYGVDMGGLWLKYRYRPQSIPGLGPVSLRFRGASQCVTTFQKGLLTCRYREGGPRKHLPARVRHALSGPLRRSVSGVPYSGVLQMKHR